MSGKEPSAYTQKALLLTGKTGEAGFQKLIAGEEETLLSHFSSYYVRKMKQTLPARDALPPSPAAQKEKILRILREVFPETAVFSVGSGGLLKTLSAVAGAVNTGFVVFPKAIHFRQELIEACHALSVSPYALFGGEDELLLVSDKPRELMQALEKKRLPVPK